MSEDTRLIPVSLTMVQWTRLIGAIGNPDLDELNLCHNVQEQIAESEMNTYSYNKEYGYSVIENEDSVIGLGLELVDDDDDDWNKVYWC